MTLTNYRTLGKSGLVVSPLALGTMTFGTARWGSDDQTSRAVFDAYVDAGGNFVDTADVYSGGRSEELLGKFIVERGLRDRIVLATKAGFAAGRGVHLGGNGAKHINAALDASLLRLRTTYVDLFLVHVWDGVTPAGELLETMATLVRAGKVRYWGMSNAPAWYVATLSTLARTRGMPGPIVLQYFYSLVNRDIDAEHVPLAADAGMGIMPWSPLAYGLLTGKYDRAVVEAAAPRASGLPRDAALTTEQRPSTDKRLDGANPFGDSLFTERNWRIVDVLREVAGEAEQSMARVALQWVVQRRGVASTLIGVSRVSQLIENIAALNVVLSPTQQRALDDASASDRGMIYSLFDAPVRQHVVFGGQPVRAWNE